MPHAPTPGWYPDPQDPSAERWWDGRRWTAEVRVQAADAGGATLSDAGSAPAAGAVEPGAQLRRRGGKRTLLVLGGVLLAATAGVGGWLAAGSGDDPSEPADRAAADEDSGQDQQDSVDADEQEEWAVELARRIGSPRAQLSFRRVLEEIPPGSPRYDEGPDCAAPIEERTPLPLGAAGILCSVPDAAGSDPGQEEALPSKYEVSPAKLTADHVDAASVEEGPGPVERSVVVLEFDDAGSELMQAITADLACERDAGLDGRFAIVVDGVVESAPGVSAGVRCGVGMDAGAVTITGAAR